MLRPKSVLLGNDSQALELLIGIHCPIPSPKILDCTYNTGKIWKGTTFNPVKMDINSELEGLDVVGDFKKMPFPDAQFDIVVFDPPHLPSSAASIHSSGIYKNQYGITNDTSRQGDNVSSLFSPFFFEAKRVLKNNGIVLAKIADLIHNHKYQWQHLDFIIEARNAGITPCDMLIKVDKSGGNLASSKWKNVKHLRNSHSYWIVVRNSKKCEHGY